MADIITYTTNYFCKTLGCGSIIFVKSCAYLQDQVSCRTDLPPLYCRDYNASNQYSQTLISLSSQTPPSRRYLMYAVSVFGLRMRLSYSPRGALSDIEIQLHMSNSETKHRYVENATEFSFRKCRNVERR